MGKYYTSLGTLKRSRYNKKKREILPPGLHYCNVRQLRNARARCAESGDKL